MTSRRHFIVGSLLILVATGAVSAQYPRPEPVDEGVRNPGFLAFRTELLRTIARRDVTGLLRVVHPDIRNTFGDDNGIEAFKKMWRLDQPDSEVWKELGDVLRLGGTFLDPDLFVAPYVHSVWPDEFDPFDHVALTGSNVRVRAAPDATAHSLRTLSFAILELKGDLGYRERPWTAVVLPDGQTGYVASRLVRSAVDYRAFFGRQGGRWVMWPLSLRATERRGFHHYALADSAPRPR